MARALVDYVALCGLDTEQIPVLYGRGRNLGMVGLAHLVCVIIQSVVLLIGFRLLLFICHLKSLHIKSE